MVLLCQSDICLYGLVVNLLAVDLSLHIAAKLIGLGQVRIAFVELVGYAKVAANLFVQVNDLRMEMTDRG